MGVVADMQGLTWCCLHLVLRVVTCAVGPQADRGMVRCGLCSAAAFYPHDQQPAQHKAACDHDVGFQHHAL